MPKRATDRRKFENVNAKLLAHVGEGETLIDACSRVGVNPHTARNWVTEGHRDPEGRYGEFARGLDAARTRARLASEEDDGYEPGAVEREVIALIIGRKLDAHGRVAAVQARACARQIDVLSAARSGSAALGLVAASRRLDDVIVALQIQPKDALTEIQESYKARRARMRALYGNGVADVS
jgi:hypothetical protein